MKRFAGILFLILIVWVGGARAAGTPAERNCRIASGQPLLLNPGKPDDLELCIFDLAMIGSETLYEFTVLKSEPLAVLAYIQTQRSGPATAVCSAFNGIVIQKVSNSNTQFSLCLFSDGSIIEASTLARGRFARENNRLTAILTESH